MKVYVVLEHEPEQVVLEGFEDEEDPPMKEALIFKRIVCVTESETTARIRAREGRLVRTLECWEVDGAEVLL